MPGAGHSEMEHSHSLYKQKQLVLSNAPGAGEKLTVKCSGARNLYVQMPGCHGGDVKTGIERDINIRYINVVID